LGGTRHAVNVLTGLAYAGNHAWRWHDGRVIGDTAALQLQKPSGHWAGCSPESGADDLSHGMEIRRISAFRPFEVSKGSQNRSKSP
jgi:hypothetical protein